MFQFDIEKAVKFLESQYDPEIGLLREAPQVQPNWFWVWIDNFLAMYVINKYQWHHPLALKILDGLKRVGFFQHSHGRMEVVLGELNITFPWVLPSKTIIAQVGDKTIWNEVCDGSAIGGWTSYADLLFLATIYYQLKGGFLDKLWAKYYFGKAKGMWSGKGFSDCITKTSGKHATYKLALYLIASKKLGVTSDLNDKCREIIGQQQAPSGGVWTDYIKLGDVGQADTNTETTTLCILAYL